MAEPPEDSQPAEDQPREPGPAITIEEVGEVSPEDERVAELILGGRGNRLINVQL